MKISRLLFSVMIIVFLFSSFAGCSSSNDMERPLRCVMDGINQNNPEKLLNALFPSWRDRHPPTGLNAYCEEMKEYYGADAKCTYVIDSNEALGEGLLSELISMMATPLEIEEAAALRLTVSFTGSDDTDTELWLLYVMKVDGQWYLAELYNLRDIFDLPPERPQY